MNRRSFFGRAAVGAAVVAAAPQMLANIPEITLPRLVSGNIRWDLIDRCGEACMDGRSIPPSDPRAREYQFGNTYLRNALQIYLEDTGYPCNIVDMNKQIAWTRKLKVRYDIEYLQDIKAFSGQHITEQRDYWRGVIMKASQELIDVWDEVAPTGTLLLYRAMFTPMFLDPESFEAFQGILIRACYPRK